MRNLLIIFVKNAEPGKVKTRLAKSIGPEKALLVYKKLLAKTRETVLKAQVEKQVNYSNRIDLNDIWENNVFQKTVQKGVDLGERMYYAFCQGFNNSYRKICLIGSDIFDLTEIIIEDAFTLLDDHDIVIGPSNDGGYYLIGMKSSMKEVFENKSWSTDSVLTETIESINALEITYALLPVLNDIDVLQDMDDKTRKNLLP